MKAVQFARYGGPEVLEVIEREVPTPGAGQLLVKVSAIGVNFADVMQRLDTYPTKFPLPFVPGYEANGYVEAVGEGVEGFKPGQRVTTTLMQGGAYAEYLLAPAEATIPLPDGVDESVALALKVQGLTAYYLLKETTQLRKGQSVLVHAAAGGVGSIAVQLAKLWGASPVLGAASPGKHQKVLDLGADFAIDYTQPNWSEKVREVTDGQGVDIILDPLGAAGQDENLKAIADFGHWAIFGMLDGGPVTLDAAMAGQLMGRNLSLHGFIVSAAAHRDFAAATQELYDLVASGQINIEKGQQWPLAEAAEAQRAVEARQTTGKVILVP